LRLPSRSGRATPGAPSCRRHQTHIGDLPGCLLPRRPNCRSLRTNVPETPPCPPTARQSERDRDRAASGAPSPGGLETTTTLGRRPASHLVPVRQRLGGRAAFRNRLLILGLVSKHTPEAVPPANQSERGREQCRTEASRAQRPSSCVLSQLPRWRSSLACPSSAR